MKNLNSKEQSWIEKIELGTAQFGLHYGVNNGKKISEDESKRIRQYLYDNGSYFIDTAPSYGDSEEIVSKLAGDRNKIITKILPLSKCNSKDIVDGVLNSIEEFGDKLYGIMVHDSNDVFNSEFKYVKELLGKPENKRIKFGVSLYDPMELIRISEIMDVEMIQIPFNILDQRADNKLFKDYLESHNIEVHVRSVFLQGLLLMDKNIPESLKSVEDYRSLVRKEANKLGLTIYEFCIYFVFNQDWIDQVVIGIDNLQQAVELIEAIKKVSNMNPTCDYSNLKCMDMKLINPAKWKND